MAGHNGTHSARLCSAQAHEAEVLAFSILSHFFSGASSKQSIVSLGPLTKENKRPLGCNNYLKYPLWHGVLENYLLEKCSLSLSYKGTFGCVCQRYTDTYWSGTFSLYLTAISTSRYFLL